MSESPYVFRIPSSWKWAKVRDITHVIRGASPRPKGDPRYFGGDIPWIMISDISREPGKYLTRTKEGVTEAGSQRSRLLKRGSLILSNSGTVCVPKILHLDGCIHDGFVSFPTLPSDLSKDYLYYWFDYIRPRVIQVNKQGITQVNLNTDIVRELDIPIAPANEQRRIVEKIEELFSDLDAGVAALQRARANLKRYRASVLKAAVDGSLTVSEADRTPFAIKKWRPLSDIVLSLEQGWSPKCERENSDNPDEWVVMKTTAIQQLQYLENENKRLPPSLHPRQRLELQAGDLLITRAGPRSRAGVTCLVRQTRPRVILCDKAYRMRLDGSLVEPGYVEIILNSPPILDVLDELKTGISDSGVNLTQNRFLQLRIPVPPIGVQRDIEQEVLRLLSIAEIAEKEIASSLQRATRLRQSILKQAFEGRLVPQDPNDEPAIALLERLGKSRSFHKRGYKGRIGRQTHGRRAKSVQLRKRRAEP